MRIWSSTSPTFSHGVWFEFRSDRGGRPRTQNRSARLSRMKATESPLPPPPADRRSCAVLVIGAGIVGVATALRLRREGHDVWLIDRECAAARASRGTAGALAFSDILPLASPGVLRHAARWLLDPLGPLTIRPRYLPRLTPWLLRFWRASRRARVQAATAAQAALMTLSATETISMLAAAGASHML